MIRMNNNIKDKKAVSRLRTVYLGKCKKMHPGLRLSFEHAVVVTTWRIFDRRRWILYMEQCVNGKIPRLAMDDAWDADGWQIDAQLRAYGWE